MSTEVNSIKTAPIQSRASGPEDFTAQWVSRQIGGAERRQITVLFCDIVNSSALTAHHDPEIVAALLVRYRIRIAGIIDRYEGSVVRYVGDGILALWGYPKCNPEEARLAVSAALEIVSGADKEVDLRCALDTGIGVVGHIGASANGEPDFVGLAANTAARLQVLAPINGVLISDYMQRALGSASISEPATVTLPGHAAPVVAWHVRGLHTGWRRTDDWRPVLVGRERELEAIARHWRALIADPSLPPAVLITGESGIGKSSLAAALDARVRAEGGAAVSVGCLPERRYSAWHPVRELILAILHEAGETADTIADRVAAHTQRPSNDADGLHDWLPAFLDVDAAGRQALSNRPARPNELLLQLLTELARSRPLQITFEDIHWADDQTKAFIEHIVANRIEGGFLRIVLTTRELVRHVIRLPRRALTLVLGRLPLTDVLAILAANADAGSLDSGLLRQIAERAEGHPLLAIELAKVCRTTRRGAVLPELMSFPSRLNSVLGMRLDHLGDLKPLTQAAAVLGRRFDPRVLADVLGIGHDVVEARLQRLVVAGVVARITHGERHCYRFNHALLHEAASASVLRQNQEKLHARASRVLVEHYSAAAAADPECVALHAEYGRTPGLAFAWWRKAAERAARISSPAAAVKYLERALAQRAGDPAVASADNEIAVLRMLGPLLAAVHGNAAACVRATYHRALDLDRVLGASDPERSFDLLWGLQTCDLVAGRILDAVGNAGQLIALGETIGTDGARLVAHRMRGLTHLLSGHPLAASADFSTVRQLYDQRRHQSLRLQYASDQGALALAQDAWANAAAGNVDAAAERADAALALADALKHPHTSAHVTCVLAAAAQMRGDLVQAAGLARAGRALGDLHGFPYWSAWAQIVDGWLEGRADPGSGVKTIRDGLVRYQATGAEQALPYARLLLAQTLLSAGRPTAASAVAMEGLRHAEEMGLRLWLPGLLRLISSCAAQSGNRELAAQLQANANHRHGSSTL